MGREWSWRQWEGLQRSCRGEDDSCSLSHLSCHSLLWLSAQGLYCESPGSLLRLSIIRSLHDSPLCLSAVGFLLWPLYHGSLPRPTCLQCVRSHLGTSLRNQ